MNTIKLFCQPKFALVTMLLAIFVAALVTISVGQRSVMAAGTGPCDIYASGGTPCVAAHSSVRALYGSYNGNLYQVRRTSDNTTRDIAVLSAGGFANSATQDSFCAGTTCTISIIYDQSGRGNHLRVAPAGGAGGADKEAIATSERLTVGGNWVYSVYTSAGMGYRNNNTSGVATGDQPESMYMVTSGTHYNGACCYDYGNAETNNLDNGNGHMEAIYFGNCNWWGEGSGSGPWVMADLENGVFAGQTLNTEPNNTPIIATYVTAMVKGEANHFAIKGGNAQSGTLKTMYDGARPINTSDPYNPMSKEGAIILGIGGDNSNGSAGTFYEGAMTTGYASDATDNAIQANIIAAGYGPASSGGPTGYTWCAGENGTCTFSGTASVAYGANGVFNYRTATNSIACNNATFGDPLSGVVKACYYQTSGSGTTWYSINNINSGKVMDVQWPNTTAGTKVGQYGWNGQYWQQWQFVDKGSGYFNIVSRNSGMCLDVNGASTADGAAIIQWNCNNQNNQQFQWRASGSNYQLVARHSGKCIDVVGSSTADSALLEQRTCSTANNFLWNRTAR